MLERCVGIGLDLRFEVRILEEKERSFLPDILLNDEYTLFYKIDSPLFSHLFDLTHRFDDLGGGLNSGLSIVTKLS